MLSLSGFYILTAAKIIKKDEQCEDKYVYINSFIVYIVANLMMNRLEKGGDDICTWG